MVPVRYLLLFILCVECGWGDNALQWNHICQLNDKENGTLYNLEDCPFALEQEKNGFKVPRVCNFKVCSNLVCCPNTPKPRLRQDCSYEHPDQKIEETLWTNRDCVIDGLEGIYTPKDQYSRRCSYYDGYEEMGKALPNVCDYEFCQDHICCPKTHITNTTCRIAADYNFDAVEITAGSCKIDGTGESGICRPKEQCPSQPWNGNHTVCGQDCCSTIICCPEPNPSNTKKSQRVCANFRKSVFHDQKEISTFFPADVEDTRKCIGVKSGYSSSASPKEFPHVAVLGYHNNETNSTVWQCSGVLISDQFVLTTGRCLYSQTDGPLITVRLGTQNLDIKEQHYYNTDCPEEFEVVEHFPHPNFTINSRYNDIALAKLKIPVQFKLDFYPACLPDSSVIPTYLTITGFELDNTDHNHRGELAKKSLNSLSHNQCNDSYHDFVNKKLHLGIDGETQFCAGSKYAYNDPCSLEAGAPIHADNDKYYKLATVFGVKTFGKGCEETVEPAVFTRIYPFVEWIEEIVWPKIEY